jgi:hypothetical protein
MSNRNKEYELKNIDDFIKSFNNPAFKLGKLSRLSDDGQENPDAILKLNDQKRIALEATVALPIGYRPHETVPNEYAYNPTPAIDKVIEAIEKKSLASYRSEDTDEVWLLISGGAYISDHDLKERLPEITRNSFDRIFIHKGISAELLEITK